MKHFAAAVEKATGGKVAIDVHGSSVLGSEEKMLLATQAGTQDLYMGALSPISARKKEMQTFDVTRAFQRSAELKQAAEVVGELKSRGMSVTEMPAAELDKIRAAVQPVVDKNAEAIGKDFVQSFYAVVKRYRAARK
jgi:TRAP-type C4-dicarboxylate transport system substrate-binding protein